MSIYTFALPSGEIVTVDAADRALVDMYNWRAVRRPNTSCTYVHGYPKNSSQDLIYLHRMLLNPPPDKTVDHINGDGLDNRRVNLRLAAHAENCANRGPMPNNKSGYKGVSWHKRAGKWQASIKRDNRTRHLGLFEDPWEAAEAYNAASISQWGEFAWLNRKGGPT